MQSARPTSWILRIGLLLLVSGCAGQLASKSTDDGGAKVPLPGEPAADAGPGPCQTKLERVRLLAINAGGPAVGEFTEDGFFSGGTPYAVSQEVDTAGVTGAAPKALYQSYRYGFAAPVSYTFAGLSASPHVVRLHFAEIYNSATGQRRFDVSVNGEVKLAELDIFAEAGGAHRALVKELAVSASAGGELVLGFSPIPGKDSAAVSGIELLELRDSCVPAPPTTKPDQGVTPLPPDPPPPPPGKLPGDLGDASPAVSIVTPSSGFTMAAPAHFLLSARATDPDGIDKVEFFLDADLVRTAVGAASNYQSYAGASGNFMNLPEYSQNFMDLPPGQYTVSVRGFDRQGNARVATALLKVVAVAGRTLKVNLPAAAGELAFSGLQAALDAALPGDRILVGAGSYTGPFQANRSGTIDRPILVESEKRLAANLKSNGSTHTIVGGSGTYLTLRGFLLTGRAGYQLGAGHNAILPRTGWHIEDCKLSGTGHGIGIKADHVAVVRTVLEENMHNSLQTDGDKDAYDPHTIDQYYKTKDAIVDRVLIRRGNVGMGDPQNPNKDWDHPANAAGAMKIIETNRFMMSNLISYGNYGAGIWFDIANFCDAVIDSTVFGNRGLDATWQGPGLWYEINYGPLTLDGNTFHSNTGWDVSIMESQNVTVSNNHFGGGGGLGLRMFGGRPYKLANIKTRGNTFHGGTGIGNDAGDQSLGGYDLDEDLFANVGKWVSINTLGPCSSVATCSPKGIEAHGQPMSASFPVPRLAGIANGIWVGGAKLKGDEGTTIDAAIQGASVGQQVALPVFGRTRVLPRNGAWVSELHDLQGRYVRVTMTAASAKQLEALVPKAARLTPILVKVTLSKLDSYRIEASY